MGKVERKKRIYKRYFDVAMIAAVFGNVDEYDQALDLSGNGEVDIFDVAEIAKVFGQTVP